MARPNEPKKDRDPNPGLKETTNDKLPSEDKDTSTYTTTPRDQASDVDGSRSITSNILYLVKDTDDEEGTDPSLMEVDRDLNGSRIRGAMTLIICNG